MTGKNRNVRDFIFNGYAFQKQLEMIEDIERNQLDSPLGSVEEIIEPFLDDFPDYIRRRAQSMARYYEIIYLLEDKLRSIIIESMFDEYGADWWIDHVPEPIKGDVQRLQQKEIDLGISLRSKRDIDFTTFGQLTEIIKTNADVVGARFTSISGLQRILGVLNNLRGPIAHSTVLAPDEVARLYVAVRDFFRLIRRNVSPGS